LIDLPLSVRMPARYLGNEVNVPVKSLDKGMFRVALAFADTYEVGMSHIGMKILYDILNGRPDIFCERVFAPWTDMMRYMREHGLPLASLETKTPLNRFDMVGFSLQYEMSYPTLLTMLKMGEIPRHARKRGSRDPWVLAGGPCAVNPEPLADFIDAFVIGDGERVVLEIADCLKRSRDEGIDRDKTLERLAEIEGIYVPGFHEVNYGGDGRPVKIRGSGGKKAVSRRIEKDLDALPFPTRVVVPVVRAVHDRYAVEIARGCLQGCRFCQAGFIYRPYRERGVANVLRLLKEGLEETGYSECSFLSLSAGDYSEVSRLLEVAVERNLSSMVSISLPSLRVTSLTPEMIEGIKKIRKTGFTIAPEAGTQRLRNVISKKIDEDEILTTIETIFRAGWHLVKLYFMIGLPTERQEDIEGLVELVTKAWRMARKISRKNEVTASVSTFIPKPHTPFQWCGMISLEEIRERQNYIRRKLRRRGLKVKWHDARLSYWEGVLSRGGRPLGEFLYRLSEEGAYLDGWTDQFSGDLWERISNEFDLSVITSGLRPWDPEAIFPWDVIDVGIERDYLWREYQSALEAAVSPPCPEGPCRRCGVCDASSGVTVRRSASKAISREVKLPEARQLRDGTPPQTLEVVFMKVGDARYVGHLDMVRAFLMAARRARLPMAYSQGFHPAPKVRFSSPIPLGMESLREVVVFTLTDPVDPVQMKKALNLFLPKGLRILKAKAGFLKRSEGFDTFKVSKYMCLFRVFDAREAALVMSAARRILSGGFEEVLFPLKGEEIPVSLGNVLKIEEINSYPRWVKLIVQIGPLPKGVRPMPLMKMLFEREKLRVDSMRMIKIGGISQTPGEPGRGTGHE